MARRDRTADLKVGVVARLIGVDAEGRGTFRLSDGRVVNMSADGFDRGDTVLIGDDFVEACPPDAWPNPDLVGVVRAVVEDVVVIEHLGGVQQAIPASPAVPVEVGDVVAFDQAFGPSSVLGAGGKAEPSDKGTRNDVLLSGAPAGAHFLVEPDDHLSFERFGGYGAVVAQAKRLILTRLERKAHLDRIGARLVRGVLLTGPPGTGKTYLAKVIAAEAKARFYLVSGPEIVSKWVGDTEATLRNIFEAAAEDERAIIFFDEIDSIAPARGGDTHEMSKKLVAQFLTSLDGFSEAGGNVVVLAATNRVGDIDPALRRPGRFDWEIQFGLPSPDDRRAILAASSAGVNVADDLQLDRIADECSGWSAAELSSLWTEAAMEAAGDDRDRIEREDLLVAHARVGHNRREKSNGPRRAND